MFANSALLKPGIHGGSDRAYSLHRKPLYRNTSVNRYKHILILCENIDGEEATERCLLMFTDTVESSFRKRNFEGMQSQQLLRACVFDGLDAVNKLQKELGEGNRFAFSAQVVLWEKTTCYGFHVGGGMIMKIDKNKVTSIISQPQSIYQKLSSKGLLKGENEQLTPLKFSLTSAVVPNMQPENMHWIGPFSVMRNETLIMMTHEMEFRLSFDELSNSLSNGRSREEVMESFLQIGRDSGTRADLAYCMGYIP
ncbi:MAG: hypothetical protein AAF388_15325 [Bacteroidota bacterium]